MVIEARQKELWLREFQLNGFIVLRNFLPVELVSRMCDELQPLLEAWMEGKSRTEVVDALNAAGVPAGPVYSAADIFADDHFRRRGMLVEVEDPEVGPSTFARTPPHLSAAPEIATVPAPDLGQHSREVLEGLLEYSSGDVDRLIEAEAHAFKHGVIRLLRRAAF